MTMDINRLSMNPGEGIWDYQNRASNARLGDLATSQQNMINQIPSLIGKEGNLFAQPGAGDFNTAQQFLKPILDRIGSGGNTAPRRTKITYETTDLNQNGIPDAAEGAGPGNGAGNSGYRAIPAVPGQGDTATVPAVSAATQMRNAGAFPGSGTQPTLDRPPYRVIEPALPGSNTGLSIDNMIPFARTPAGQQVAQSIIQQVLQQFMNNRGADLFRQASPRKRRRASAQG